MTEKTFIDANRLLEMSYQLGNMVLASDFRPTHIVGIWRGGAPIGIAVQELLEFHGASTDHIAIRTSSYSGIDRQEKEVKVLGLNYLIDTLEAEHRLLIVDDVFDSGRSIQAFKRELRARCRRNTPDAMRTATVFYKPSRNVTHEIPDFFVEQTEQWLVFPHELVGLSKSEIRDFKANAGEILRYAGNSG